MHARALAAGFSPAAIVAKATILS